MLPRTRRQRKTVSVGLATLLLFSPVSSQCGTQSGVRWYGGCHVRSAGFISGTRVVVGGGRVQPAAEAASAPTRWASAWQGLPQGRKNCSYPRPPSRTVGRSRQKHLVGQRSAKTGQDNGIDTPVASSSRSAVEVNAESRPVLSGRAAAEGRGDFGGGGRGSNDSGAGVHSLVDLVKLLHNADNPVWELVRFEVWRVGSKFLVSHHIYTRAN